MIYMHESNLKTKIAEDYKGLSVDISNLHKTKYLPLRKKLLKLTFDENHILDFDIAAELINDYYKYLVSFKSTKNINSHSKFESSFFRRN